MGPSMERGVRSRITLGLVGPAENRQVRLKQLSVYAHIQTEIPGRASRAHWEVWSSLKMGKVARAFR